MSGPRTVSPGPRCGTVTVPSSKSHVHRLLIAAALGESPVSIRLRGFSKDILATADCLRALGAEIGCTEGSLSAVPPDRSRMPGGEAVLPCGESGSTLRFLLPVLGALGLDGCFHMEGRLPQRPMDPFEDELRRHGMVIARDGSLLRAGGRLSAGSYCLPGNISSQYFTGLLFALPLLEGDSVLRAEGSLESAAYIRMTESVLESAGIVFSRAEHEWRIPGGQTCRLPRELTAEGDWSGAAFFLCLGALSDHGITVRGLRSDSPQGDRSVLDTLLSFGAELNWHGDAVTVRAGKRRPFVLDAAGVPDLVPVLSVLACAADGESVIKNAARLRMKESDRLRSTAQLIMDLGGTVDEREDGLVIHGRGALRGGNADSFHDHRIAMSAAVAAALCREPVIICDPDCVEKSYPDFWKDIEGLSGERSRTCQVSGSESASD
ncbi:MAG: 3-phosphoshikimate 1-carboxyvinyltransferase [Oscillospiraceae bacterium]|nr:3-phosphoshikimate 1-carboxyvinyltransferase [Oscillospiraceae bacterium]